MERILYFDCFSGISGDMTLGALMDLGIDPNALKTELDKLHLEGYHLHAEKTQKQAITGTDVDVHIHDHDHNHDHPQDHTHDEAHSHHHEHSRNLQDITELIHHSHINPKAKALAVSIFTEIAAAEAKVHGKSLDEVHFHEVGAVDSIVDIVGTAICFDLLQVDRIGCSPIREGQGFVQCQHGKLPVPVPAVAQMLIGSRLSLLIGDTQGELVTPTGFGILKATADFCGPMPPMKVERVGYGFGKKETGSLNALRVFLGTAAEEENTITVLEANLDDETGEILGYVLDLLLEAGALDVHYTPVYMKKNRPGVTVTVLCHNDRLDKMAEILLRETTTIGLRHYRAARTTLTRFVRQMDTPLGSVGIKISEHAEMGIRKEKPEYQDCVRLAKEHHLPLREIYRQLLR